MVTPFLFTKKSWSRDSYASCHIINNNTGLYDITDINESIQGSSHIMPAMKEGKLLVKARQDDMTQWANTLWPVKFCPKIGSNLFSLTCKLSQGNKIASDHQNKQHSGRHFEWRYHP